MSLGVYSDTEGSCVAVKSGVAEAATLSLHMHYGCLLVETALKRAQRVDLDTQRSRTTCYRAEF